MRFKEVESERLKGEERTLLEQQAELERLDAERTRLADERRKREHGSASLLHIVQTVQIAQCLCILHVHSSNVRLLSVWNWSFMCALLDVCF